MISAAHYIDDAGTPGAESNTTFLSESRKSWCAVTVPEKVADALGEAMGMFLSGVRQDFGADELHFTDVYGGRGKWKGVPVDARVEIFDLMTGVFEAFQLPVVFQTVSRSLFSDHAELFSRTKLKPGQFWDIKSIPHLGLLLTCFQISRYFDCLQKKGPHDFPQPLPAYADEGLAKAGAEVSLPNWGRAIQGRKLTFQRSLDTPGLQLADFAAFSISRTQWLAAKQEKGTPISEADKHIMAISGRLNLLNLDMVSIDPVSFSRDDYEDYLSRDRAEKGLPKWPFPSAQSDSEG